VSIDVPGLADLEQVRGRWRSAVAGVLSKSTRRDAAELGDQPEHLLDAPTYDGFAIRPLYTVFDELPEPPLPGEWPYVRGGDALREGSEALARKVRDNPIGSILIAGGIGFALGFTGISAIHMLVWSAVLNGIVAVPVMAMMMVIVANPKVMGRFKARSWLVALGWLGTALMAVAVAALVGSSLLAP